MADNKDRLVEGELLAEILRAIKSGDDETRQAAVYQKVLYLKDKQKARDEFVKLLYHGLKHKKKGKNNQDSYDWDDPDLEDWGASAVRSWAASALATLAGTKDKIARDEVANALKREKNSTARYWMLASYYKMGGKRDIQNIVADIAKGYKQAVLNDTDLSFESPDAINDRAAPLALAIQANWGDAEAVTCLETILKSNSFSPMWAVCRALEMVSVRDVLGTLTEVASNVRTWPDIRSRCVYAIGQIESPAAAKALGGILAYEQDVLVREAAVQGLVKLGTSRVVRKLVDKSVTIAGENPYSITDTLLTALLDPNAQIRYIAAKAIFDVMLDLDQDETDETKINKARTQAKISACEKVVSEIVKEQVDIEHGVPLLVDALRLIDPPEAESAAMVLSRYLFSEDVSVRQRAERALRMVGGEKAVQTLMGQKSEVLRAYNDLLTKTDEPIQDLFRETMRQARFSFLVSQIMSIVIFIVGIGTIIAGLYFAFQSGNDRVEIIFGAGTSVVGAIAVLLDLMVRDPHKRVQEATSVLLRIKVIFLGYLRQIHQIDATFKHEFIEGGKEFGQKDVESTTKLITAVMSNTMKTITQNLPVSKNEKLAVDTVFKKWQEVVSQTGTQAETPETEAPENASPDKTKK